MERRNFLKGFAAVLAAAAVVPNTALALPEDDYARLVRLLRDGGEIRGMSFVFHNGETIDLRGLGNVSFSDCDFVWRTKAPDRAVLRGGDGNLTMHMCRLKLEVEQDAHYSGIVAAANGHFETPLLYAAL